MESPGTVPTSPTSAAEEARKRRERRQAKLKDGTSRLNRITSTQSNSRLYETASGQTENVGSGTATPSVAPAPVGTSSSVPPLSSESRSGASAHVHDDPPDVILSEHFYQPSRQSTPQRRQKEISTNFSPSPLSAGGLGDSSAGPSEEEMVKFLAQYGGAGAAGGQLPEMGTANDPMMALMQQMMGIPPPIGAQGEAGVNAAQPLQQQQGQDKWDSWWKVLHTLGALLLTFWSLKVSGLGLEYDGSLEQREAETHQNPNFFYYFATMELVLQSSRFIIEKGRPPPGSMLVMIGQMLPPKIGNYFITIARYSVIWTTVMNDAFVVVFVMGMVAWWNSSRV